MTSRRDLGPKLGVGLAVLIVGACIAGLMVIGGPKQARDERVDEATLRAVSEMGTAIKCYLEIEGQLPNSASEFEIWLKTPALVDYSESSCRRVRRAVADNLFSELEYRKLDDTTSEICAVFLRASEGQESWAFSVFDQPNIDLDQARENPGDHCFEAKYSKPETG